MKKNNNNWLYLIISILGASTIIFLCLFLSFQNTSKSYKQTLENNYKKNFYEVASNINDLEVDISKVIATKDVGTLNTLLSGLHSNVILTLSNVNQLPITYDKLTNINMLLNKTGGFVQSLLDRIFDGQTLNNDDYLSLSSIHASLISLKYDLKSLLEKIFPKPSSVLIECKLLSSSLEKPSSFAVFSSMNGQDLKSFKEFSSFPSS